MNAVLEQFCSRLVSLGLNVFAQDKTAKDGWITVHPNGKENKGQHVEIDDETGGVKKGFGGKFKGQKISEIKSKFRGPQVNRLNERPDLKPEPKPMRTPAPQTSAGQKLGGRLQELLQKRQQEMEKSQTAPGQQASPSSEQSPVSNPAFIPRSAADIRSQYEDKRGIAPEGMTNPKLEAKKKELREKIDAMMDAYISGKTEFDEARLKDLVLEEEIIKDAKVKKFSWQDQKSMTGLQWPDIAESRATIAVGLMRGARQRAQDANPAEMAGQKRGQPMDLEQADRSNANPHYDPFWYTKSSRPDGYGINCQTCVFAYELRRRGYNVEAQPNSGVVGTMSWKVSVDTARPYVNIVTGRKPERVKLSCSDTKDEAKCLKMLDVVDKTIKPGQRWSFECRWAKTRSGHIFSLEKGADGQLILTDPQTGILCKGKQDAFDRYFSVKSRKMSEINMFRTDDTLVLPEYSGILTGAGK